jgi:hypothetical protein
MVILLLFMIFWTSYAVTWLMPRAQHARTPTPTPPQPVHAEPSRAQLDAGSHDGPVWSALDDRQLTRLLTDSAPRTIIE